MTPPRIAAVIPAFNSAVSVGAAIASARGQTRPPDEIIVVDDGSADETASIAEQAGARVIRQPNRGPGAARNAGIKATNAEWIALLDADDAWRPERLASQVTFTAEPDIGLVFAGTTTGRVLSPLRSPTLTFDQLWERNCIPTSTVLMRRAAWEQVGGFNERRDLIGVEDYNLWLRMAHANWRLLYVPHHLVEYEPTDASLTSQKRRFATAEVTHLRVIAEELGMESERVRAKEFVTYLHYGQELFYYRQLRDAREFLRGAAQRGILPMKARLQLLASYLPLPPRGTG